MASLITKLLTHHKEGIALKAEIKAQRPSMTATKLLVLGFIAEADRSVTEVAVLLDQTTQSVGHKFEKLEAMGLIKSYPGKEDKRQRFVKIMAKGRKLLDKLV